jgi:hypothetical protein
MRPPDYQGGSIVNLMSSVTAALDGGRTSYPRLTNLDPALLGSARNIVLVVIDGLGYDFLTRAGAGTSLIHFLKARISSVFPPATATAIPTFLTGAAPQQHGFTGWFTYFKELGSVVAVLPFRARHGGASLEAIGIDPSDLCRCRPVFERVRARAYAVMPEWIVRSPFNLAFNRAARNVPYRSLEEFFELTRWTLRDGVGRRYVYAYWPELDRLAHSHGIGSAEVRRHLAELDAGFSRLVQAIRGSDTVLIVTADHGFVDIPPGRLVELSAHPPLNDALVVPLCGEPRLAYCYIHPDKRDIFERYARRELAHCVSLWRSEELLRHGYFGVGEPHPRLADRIGHYALAMTGDYAVKDWLLREKPYRNIGVHGGTSPEELDVPLVVVES